MFVFSYQYGPPYVQLLAEPQGGQSLHRVHYYQYVHPTVPLLPVPPDGQLHAVASSLHQLVLQNIKIVFSTVNYM